MDWLRLADKYTDRHDRPLSPAPASSGPSTRYIHGLSVRQQSPDAHAHACACACAYLTRTSDVSVSWEDMLWEAAGSDVVPTAGEEALQGWPTPRRASAPVDDYSDIVYCKDWRPSGVGKGGEGV